VVFGWKAQLFSLMISSSSSGVNLFSIFRIVLISSGFLSRRRLAAALHEASNTSGASRKLEAEMMSNRMSVGTSKKVVLKVSVTSKSCSSDLKVQNSTIFSKMSELTVGIGMTSSEKSSAAFLTILIWSTIALEISNILPSAVIIVIIVFMCYGKLCFPYFITRVVNMVIHIDT